MRSKTPHLPYVALILLLASSVLSASKQASNDSLFNQVGGNTLLDGSLQVSGNVQSNGHFDLIGISTPSTPAANHASLFLSTGTSSAICAVFDSGGTSCMSGGGAAGTITGVTAGNGLTGGGTTGTVSLAVDSSIVDLLASTQTWSASKTITNPLTVRSTFTVTTASVSINTVPYSFPPAQGASSTFLKNNGSGVLTWGAASASTTGTIIQIASGTLASQFSTASNAFQATGLKATIIPTSATSRVRITINTSFGSVLNSATLFITVKRGSTDLGTSTSGVWQFDGTTASTIVNMPFSAVLFDSPATTSSTVYEVYIRNDNGATTVRINNWAVNASMYLEEIGG